MKKNIALALSFGLCLTVIAPALAEQGHQSTPNHGYASTDNPHAYTTQGTQTMGHTQTVQSMAPQFKLVKTFEGEDSYSILRPAFSRDGHYLAANLNEEKMVRVWDTQTGKVLADLKPTMLFGDNQLVDGLEFTPDGKRLIVFRAGFPLKEIDWKTQKEVRRFDLGINGPKIEDYAFTPDQKRLVLGTPEGIFVFDYEKGQKLTRILESESINALDISKDGRRLAFAKKGDIEQSIGLYDLQNNRIEKYPIAQFPETEQGNLQNYQARHVNFNSQDNGLLVGYMALPQGQFKPTGPAGVFRISLNNYTVTGPESLSSSMMSFDPVNLGQPFHTTFFNTFEFDANGTSSAADFITPDLKKMKTITNADFDKQSPMLTFRVSPDQKWMAGSFKEPDGKVRLRLYQISPETKGSTHQPMVH